MAQPPTPGTSDARPRSGEDAHTGAATTGARSRSTAGPMRDVGLTTGTLRAVLSVPSTGSGRAQELAQRFADAIRVGLILDGERLPSEAQLSSQLGIASATLREVFSALRSEGLIVTKRGQHGGTFVTAPADRAAALGSRLGRLTMLEIRDLGDQRGAILTMAAELAATRGTPAHVARLRAMAERFAASRSTSALRRADASYMTEVAALAQSPRLAHEELRLQSEMGDVLWMAPSEAQIAHAAALRLQLTDALYTRDAESARALARAITEYDTRRLLVHRAEGYRTAATGHTGAASPVDQITDAFHGVAASLGVMALEAGNILGTACADGTARTRALRDVSPRIEQTLTEHHEIVGGCGVLVRPGLLSDAERWMEWRWITPSGRREPLRINLNPDAPDFYDYTVTEWYEVARRTGELTIAGPYVDASCTGAYVFTMALPMLVADEFVGVAAADLSLDVIEGLLLRHADGSDAPLLVLNRERRVLVSTAAEYLPGDFAPPGSGLREHVFDPLAH